MKPIRVYQCRGKCCKVQEPSRRFWLVRTPAGREAFPHFRDALHYAGHVAAQLPQEVTA